MKYTKPAIGELRHRIVVQKLTLTTDSIGGSTGVWSNYVTLWAEIAPYRGMETLFSQRLEENITHYIKIRRRTDLTATMRITFRNRIFQIKSIFADLEQKNFDIVYAVEGTGT